jgi:hypothetical protein
MPGFSWLLGAIPNCFKGQSLNFFAPNVLAVVALARNNHNYQSISPTSHSVLWGCGVQEF